MAAEPATACGLNVTGWLIRATLGVAVKDTVGGRGLTVMVVEDDAVAPSESVTVSVTVTGPGLLKVCVAEAPVPMVPGLSLKVQANASIVPPAGSGVDVDVNVTVVPATTVVPGETVKLAVGAAAAGAAESRAIAQRTTTVLRPRRVTVGATREPPWHFCPPSNIRPGAANCGIFSRC